MATNPLEVTQVFASSSPCPFKPITNNKTIISISNADTSSNVIPMITAINRIDISTFKKVLSYWTIAIVIFTCAASLAVLDMLHVIDFIHPYLWLTVAAGCAILAYSHFLRLKQLWLNR